MIVLYPQHGIIQKAQAMAPAHAQQFIAPMFQGDLYAAYALALGLEDKQLGEMAFVFLEGRVPREAFREYLHHAWALSHMGVANGAGSRERLGRLFRYADFPVPDHLPHQLKVYRGTHSISPEVAARGYSWTTDFYKAEWFATRSGKPLPVVISAEISTEDIDLYTNLRREREVVLIYPPRRYEICEIQPA